MEFEVYCDESRPDLLSSSNATAQYMVIGSLWLQTKNRGQFKQDIHALRNKYKIGGEFKWQKVSPSRLSFYFDLIGWFNAMSEQLRFRCIVVDRTAVNLKLYHDDDQELGFYKFYYQLLHHWILDFNDYSIFVDFKSNRRRNRLGDLRMCLTHSNLSSIVKRVQAIHSNESVLIQLVDVLTGAVSYRMNDAINSQSAKFRVLCELEKMLGRQIAPTYKNENKFNVFKIDLKGGW